MSKRDIARVAGVRPPAVNNWERRHADFPRPIDQQGRYSKDEIASWLAKRKIQMNALLPGETAGATYGERFARNLGVTQPNDRRSEAPEPTSQRRTDEDWTPPSTLWDELEKRRGITDPQVYEALTLALLHLRRYEGRRWSATLDRMARQAPSSDFIRALVSALAEHRGRHPVVREALHDVRLNNLRTAAQLAEITDVLERACAGEAEDAPPPTAAREAVLCRFLLDRFATGDGVRGGEFGTPDHLVRLMVRLLDPQPGDRIYDPSCGTGSLLVGAAAHIEEQGGASPTMSFNGEALSERSLRLAKLNLDIHGLTTVTELRRINPLRDDLHRGQSFDVILCNPPFNMADWSSGDPTADPRWGYGPPPRQNANFAWLQHIAGKLSRRGRAAVLMPNSAGVSANPRERAIRAAMVDAGVVDCVVMLPGQLFRSTSVPVTLWLLRNPHPPNDADRVQFIDARSLGTKVERGHRVLADDHIGQIVEEYRGRRPFSAAYQGREGFAATTTRADIKACDYALTAGRYVAVPPRFDPQAELKVHWLCDELIELRDRAAAADATVAYWLNEVL